MLLLYDGNDYATIQEKDFSSFEGCTYLPGYRPDIFVIRGSWFDLQHPIKTFTLGWLKGRF